MGNASKAIIIAGGMLVAVLVISVCMYMYSSFKSMYAENMLMHNVAQMEAFNMFFIQYPKEISGHDAYNIIGKVEEVNSSDDALTSIVYEGINRKNEFYFTESLDALYDYSYTYDSDGLINYVKITKSE